MLELIDRMADVAGLTACLTALAFLSLAVRTDEKPARILVKP